MKAKKAAVISESTDYAQGLKRVFKENFEKLGGEVFADETYNPEDTEFRTQVTKVKATNPDVIYIVPQTPQKGVLLIKQIKEAGLKQQLLTAEVIIGRNIVKENAADFEGLIGVEQKFDDKARDPPVFKDCLDFFPALLSPLIYQTQVHFFAFCAKACLKRKRNAFKRINPCASFCAHPNKQKVAGMALYKQNSALP